MRDAMNATGRIWNLTFALLTPHSSLHSSLLRPMVYTVCPSQSICDGTPGVPYVNPPYMPADLGLVRGLTLTLTLAVINTLVYISCYNTKKP